ncbi:MAG: TetR/AcrR family transcriptional regulator [Deltaproteobacteria bacterium]|nr:TetR/AcrR family transcriptional regulator [Deltaproteobacteria bacterium]
MSLKDNIISESLRLFSLKGFLSTSIQDIMDAAHTSKGGFYNHFKSKEALFFRVLEEARKIWRENNLDGLDQITDPFEKVKRIIINYRDRYLKDTAKLPGGCIFVTLSVELDDQRPHLSKELNKGFNGLKAMLKRYLDEAKRIGRLRKNCDVRAITELIFSVILGTTVMYGIEKHPATSDLAINSLLHYLDELSVSVENGNAA